MTPQSVKTITLVSPSVTKTTKATIDIDIHHFICPLSGSLFQDPVVCSDGHTYSRQAISSWMLENSKSPLTNSRLTNGLMIPNYHLKRLLDQFRKQLVELCSNKFLLLPVDILLWEILLRLDVLSLLNISVVCKWFWNLCKQEQFWKAKLKQDFKMTSVSDDLCFRKQYLHCFWKNSKKSESSTIPTRISNGIQLVYQL